MLARGWLVLAVLAECAFSVPVSTAHMDSEDVKVIKCIVEVLADVLSKPHSIPVSDECLQTLKTDDRLVTVLRHRNFLQELQDIAVEGANEKTETQMKDDAGYVSNHPEDLEATAADRSMLAAMERPGEEREEKRGEEEQHDEETRERKATTQEYNEASSQEKRNKGVENSGRSEEQERKRAAMKKGENEAEEEKRSSLEEEEAEEAAGAGEHYEVKKSAEEEESQEEEEKVEKRRQGPKQAEEEKAIAGVKHWSNARQMAHRRAEMGSYDQQEAPHHSKEVPEQVEGDVWKSPEEQELQMMARRDPEDRREEEGSASKKTEDAEIESLAAIESELENVAQKLHELRRG